MGVFDIVKAKADDLAAEAERTGRVAAAYARIAVLQQDLKNAERDLGQATFALVERGEIDHPELTAVAERVRATQDAIRSKETEIVELRSPSEAAAEAATVPAEAATVPAEAATTDVPTAEESPRD